MGSVHRFLLLDATPEACKEIEWLKPHFMTENGELRLSIHALVIETPSCRIIVDTCFGNDKQRENERSNMLCGSFLRSRSGRVFCQDRDLQRPLSRPYRDYITWLQQRDGYSAVEGA
jgi:hypothetical protein